MTLYVVLIEVVLVHVLSLALLHDSGLGCSSEVHHPDPSGHSAKTVIT